MTRWLQAAMCAAPTKTPLERPDSDAVLSVLSVLSPRGPADVLSPPLVAPLESEPVQATNIVRIADCNVLREQEKG